MKLINADKIKEELKLKELSHIIKQEEYLDYVLNEWKTRVVELSSYNVIEEIDNAPEVKAIPIEGILNYRKNNRNQIAYYTEDALDYMLEAWCEENNIDMWDMINSWKKENEG